MLGLPELPFVDFGNALLNERPDGVHWKSEPLVEYANGRPFAWVDDEQGDADQAHVAAGHRAPALLHHVNLRNGLRNGDFATLAAFAASIEPSSGTP
ncbi:secreted protein [Streptomyces sp. L-9-10]|nr:secreted protein [Streptomyces sp. L-9-10]